MIRRRLSLILALAAAFALAALVWLVPLSRNSQAAPAPSGDAAFKGKVLLVQTNHLMMPGCILEKAHVQKIGDHSFLVGTGAELDGGSVGQFKGRTVRLQMEHIVSITEFDNLEDLNKASKTIVIGGGHAAPVPVSISAPPAPPPPAGPVPARPPAKRP